MYNNESDRYLSHAGKIWKSKEIHQQVEMKVEMWVNVDHPHINFFLREDVDYPRPFDFYVNIQ